MGKGGGGGGGAAEAQAAREAARRARIGSSIEAIKRRFFAPKNAPIDIPTGTPFAVEQRYQDDNSGGQQLVDFQKKGFSNQGAIDSANAFNLEIGDKPTATRQAGFDDLQERVRSRFLPEFKDTVTDARRELKFALARRGIFGGSAQGDAENRFADRISEGEREISDRVTSASNEKERLDQSLINNLISQAQSDVSQSTLLSGLGSSLQSNNNRALTSATNSNLNTLFTDVGTLFKDINDSRALQQGFSGAGGLGSLLGQDKGISGIFSGRGESSGTVS